MSGEEYALVAGLYLVGILSPGPATLAIAATSMAEGRRAGLALAAGVVAGSIVWSVVAAFGLGAAMASHGWALGALKLAGGLYLLWLAFRAARSALMSDGPAPAAAPVRGGFRRVALRGLMIHLTNPKAVLFWGALFSLVVAPGKPAADLAPLLLMTSLLGVVCFSGYALLFSTSRAARLYRGGRRWFEGLFALTFGAFGLVLIRSRP